MLYPLTMQIYRYWARAFADKQDTNGKKFSVSCYRWSNESLEQAKKLAVEAASKISSSVKERLNRDAYEYGIRPLREEIIQEVDGDDGKLDAVITRNSYGSLVLNTAEVMFIDIDDEKSDLTTVTDIFNVIKNIFSPQSQRAKKETKSAIEKKIYKMCEHYDLNLRLYKTFKGYRALVTSGLFQPKDANSNQILNDFGSDPLYVKLCSAQECFRARLTPKHWRCKIPKPPCRFPFYNNEFENKYRDWQRNYESTIDNYSTCKLIDVIGEETAKPEIQKIINLHDSFTKVDTALPLA